MQQEPRPRPRCEAGWPGEVDKEKEVVDRNKERKNKDKEEKRVERRVARMGGNRKECGRKQDKPD